MSQLSSNWKLLLALVFLFINLSPANGATTGQQITAEPATSGCKNHPDTAEVRVGFLVGSQRRPSLAAAGNQSAARTSSSYSTRPVDSRLLTHVFKFLMNKLNSRQLSSSSTDAGETTASVKIKFKPIVSETFGDEQESVRQTIDLILKHQVHVILGPQETCQLEPTLASIFNVPMISHYCNAAVPALPAPAGGGDPSELQRTAATFKQSFIQTKPPSWKIVRRVVALVRRLLSSANSQNNLYYSQQLVLLYLTTSNGRRATTTTTSTTAEGASNEANQYNTIGRLLELELAAMLRDIGSETLPIETNQRRRRRQKATSRPRPSLSVLNWHTTYHYGYTENPFRRLVRRHLFGGRNSGGGGGQSDPAPQQWCSHDDQVDTKQSRAPPTTAARASNAAAAAGNKTLQQHPASTYIIVGHSYEHLGLMLALDELGLLDFGGWLAARDNKGGEHPSQLVSGGRRQWSTMAGDGVVAAAARPSAQQARRQPQQHWRQPSIVIGVDIEPHDERDDSVRFLRGLLMEGGGGGGGSGSSASSNDGGGNNQRPSSSGSAGYELSSLASKYNNYMAIVPAKPSNPTELLDEMRQFHHLDAADAGLAADAAAHEQQTSGRQTNASAQASARSNIDRLTLRMLQFARLPMEAYYLHDSIDLLGLYFSECLRRAQVDKTSKCEQQRILDDKCSRGDRMAGWFANLNYSGRIDRTRPSGFDAAARAEGLYTIVARSLAPNPQITATDSDEPVDEELDIVQVGRFGPGGSSQEDPIVELSVEPASVRQVWLPLWCTSSSARFLNLSASSESCAQFLPTLNPSSNNSALETISNENNQVDDDDDDNQEDHADARLIVLLCLFACTGGLLALMLAASASVRRERRNRWDQQRMSCAHSMLECFASGTDGASTANAARECINESDAKNFLHIVHNLLLNPAAYNGDNDDDDDDGELSSNDEADRLTGQMIASESPVAAVAYSGSLRSAALKWQQQAGEQEEAETLCGIARLRDQRQQATVDLHCYMFPFPSCKFVHWLSALHQLKEMLFKYQSSLSGGKQQFALRHSRRRTRWDISRVGTECGSKLFQSLLVGQPEGRGQSFNRTETGNADARNHRGNRRRRRLSNNRFKTGISGQNIDRAKDKWMLTCEQPLMRAQGGRIGTTTFFTGQHRGSPTVKLLLNKYKSTNECLCQLASLSHPAVVRLYGTTLASGGASASNGVKSAQLIVERTGRATLRRELAALAQSVHLSARAHEQFKAHLWRAMLTDLIEGLDYLHTRAQIGFHGTLCATQCLVTSRWRLKLTGFHVQHMRRSLGAYTLQRRETGAGAEHDDDETAAQPYLAPEVLAPMSADDNPAPTEDGARGLLSAQAMRAADIYSLGFLIYELLVGQEPWSCVAVLGRPAAAEQQQQQQHEQRNKLLAERVRVDPGFRPPISRLDKILAPFLCGDGDGGGDKRRQRRRRASTTANEEDDDHGGKSGNTTTIGRLLESCWAHLPSERPQSLAAVWSRLEAGLISKLLAAGPRYPTKEPSSESSCDESSAGARVHKRGGCTLAHYTRLVEQTARERLALLRCKQQLVDELRFSLLPCNVQQQLDGGGGSLELQTGAIVTQLDCVYLCMFRFKLTPEMMGQNVDFTYEQHHIEALTRLLSNLDELVASFRGHLHLWDSQVDSLLRYTICAGNHLQAPLSAQGHQRSRTRAAALDTHIAHSQLVATFAFELIDLANKWQKQFQGHVQVQCALHLGPAQAAYLLPQSSSSSNSRRSIMNLARCILLGRTLQVAEALEQSSQPQKIQASSEFRRELVEVSRGEPSAEASTRRSLVSSLLSGAGTNDMNYQQQQAYVMMRRTQRVQVRGVDMDTYWLLNGPRVTSSQRLTLPLVGAGSAKSACDFA